MAITSLDILNLSHSLKDICEVNCNTPECLSQTLKMLMQYNLIQANLQFSKQFGPLCIPTVCPPAQALSAPSVPSPAPLSGPSQAPSLVPSPAPFSGSSPAPFSSLSGSAASQNAASRPAAAPEAPGTSTPARSAPDPAPVPNPDTPPQRPPVRLDIGDPFLADYEK